MNKTKLMATGLLLGASFASSAQKSGFMENLYGYIENPAVFEWNQEEGRTYFIPEKHLSLNGDWRFLYNEVPESVPRNFFAENFNDAKWNIIPVPSNWEMKGYGDKLFRNAILPFKANPPFVPREYNPTGAYRKTFTLPPSWKGDRVFLRFEKVASASFVWINGKEAGYNEGGQEPAEYDVTQFLHAGKNTVAVMVTKYSDGYYLEDQDYWRLAGIFDDVVLYAAPATRLFDWQVVTDFDDDYVNSDLQIAVDVKRYADGADEHLKIKAVLLDNSANEVASLVSESFTMSNAGKKSISMKKNIAAPLKWTSETPDLYTLKLQLLSEDANRALDRAETRIGFKKTEIRGEVFYLNGVPIKLSAINSHMQHPQNGHVMDEATIRRDFEILKQFNFNAVRTSHYPPVNKYLELADEYGVFIIDEAGTEAHATTYLSERAEYAEMYKERGRQMVLRDRNHPSVLFWSAGNESGYGSNIEEVIKEGRKYDKTRFWMYGDHTNVIDLDAEDIMGPRYPTPIELAMRIGQPSDEPRRRPSFMDEYLSVAGNGGGAMDDYWRVIRSYPRILGGAIWDFVSPGLTEPVRRTADRSPFGTPAHFMGNIRTVKGVHGKALDLNGHDQWVEVYRQSNVEIASDKLTLLCDVYPRKLSGSCGAYITKGNNQFGLQQYGKDSIDFYICTDKKYRLRVPLPDKWEYEWHQLRGVYDGKEMAVYIDGRQQGVSLPATGRIRNFPFPVNVGRNAEAHTQDVDVYICDALMDNVGVFTDAVEPKDATPEKSVLWLDFEQETNHGTFYTYAFSARTYGSIWADRSVQPEMWQMKKSTQPLAATLLNADKGLVEIRNHNNFLDLSYYNISWHIEADDKNIQEGRLDLQIPPSEKKQIRIPCSRPEIVPGTEYRLTINATLRKDELWAKAGHEVAWEQMELPWYKHKDSEPATSETVALKQSDREIVVVGKNFIYTFDRKKAALTSMNINGKEMLRSPLSLNVWRAPLANELDGWNAGNASSTNQKDGYGRQVAAEFYSLGIDSLSHNPVSIEAIDADGTAIVKIMEFSTFRETRANGFENLYTYTIYGDGIIRLRHTIIPMGKTPLWLPRIGLTMTLDKSLENVEWYGRGPQENYPDRKTGYKIGIYKSTVRAMYEPYLIPQDYGLRTDNRRVAMTDDGGEGLMFSVNEKFNFNACHYATENLTKAVYTYQLQEQDGITFNLDYNTSGTGCTARSILPAYRAQPQLYEREIMIAPVSMNKNKLQIK